MDPSSITTDHTSEPTDPDPDFKESVVTFQNKTNAQFVNMEYNFRQMTETLNTITDSLTDLHSCQNGSVPQHSRLPHHTDSTSSTKSHISDDTDDDDDPPISPTPFGPTSSYMPTGSPAQTGMSVPPQVPGTSNLPSPHRYWKIDRDENLEAHRFQTLIKDITLVQDDSLQALCHFYNCIRHAMHKSFKKHVDILPPFGQLMDKSTISLISLYQLILITSDIQSFEVLVRRLHCQFDF